MHSKLLAERQEGVSTMLAIRLSETIEARLNALAQETGRSKSEVERELGPSSAIPRTAD